MTPTTAPAPPARDDAVAAGVRWIVDNADAYDALLAAIAGARRSIWISQLAFDADCVAYDGGASGAGGAPGRRLVDALVGASVARAVDVRVLLNASLLLDTAKPLRAFLQRAGASAIEVRGIGRFPQLLHAKLVIVDDDLAFVIGSPFVNGYWDDPTHRPHDARRPVRELGGRPLHDLSVRVTGSAVATLRATFAEWWNDVADTRDATAALPVPRERPRDGTVRVVRTAPRGVLPAHPDGLAEILPAILSGLARARSLVYIEHQYLSARPVVDALAAALRREPALEAIVVLNQNPDVTAYRGWQNARLRESRLLDHPRLGLFSLWSVACATPGDAPEVNQVFVHSKALLVDDAWTTVGSANLDGVSLHSYGDDFASDTGRRVFRHVRNFDVNVVLDDTQGDTEGVIGELRARLWSEHLGQRVRASDPRPAGGWLTLWRASAARNVRALRGDADAPAFRGFVLPYSTRSTPREQLADVGADVQQLRVCFDPSWLEVHCSPNWVRNMFA